MAIINSIKPNSGADGAGFRIGKANDGSQKINLMKGIKRGGTLNIKDNGPKKISSPKDDKQGAFSKAKSSRKGAIDFFA